MNSVYFEDVLALRDQWLEEQIRQLSIDILVVGTYTCTACGEVVGEYIIDHSGEQFRLSKSETYSFLKYILATRSPSK
ncbi:TFIIB-type zinc ribbon-containing protein [Pseudanabaena sp. UWO311]|uniref:TFIIB-type zinc ribbon-containing protein n=1 Tax=Pseudanabaena sp. UWO311 TaxID=2487337 RepID=UPI00115A346C|nr:TFIIB-type zinc ribbon-containing protein [Pseudanabaena sp. UWO311]TYQ27735.1 TFIIB-type zinc ribbon-containing protein [Pseudanabaena sp. UWO311]